MQNLHLFKCTNTISSTYRFASSAAKPSIISRIRYVLNHYWLGSKLLYQNSKSAREIGKKDVHSLTRNDNLVLEQFRYDIRVGIPFVALFSIPIIGYSAPLIALIAPKYLPSTLIMPEQKVKFLKEDAKASATIIDSLIQCSNQQINLDSIYGRISTMQFLNQVSDSDDRFNLIMSSIPSYSSLFSKSFSLSSLPREHLLLLHQSVLHSSFVARYFLVNYSLETQLEMWEYQTFIDDKQLKNIDQFSPYMLVTSLYRRGLYLHFNDMAKVLQIQQTNNLNQTNNKLSKSPEQIEIDQKILNDWKLLLNQWIEIHQKLSKYNPTSTSFLLHISPLLTHQ